MNHPSIMTNDNSMKKYVNHPILIDFALLICWKRMMICLFTFILVHRMSFVKSIKVGWVANLFFFLIDWSVLKSMMNDVMHFVQPTKSKLCFLRTRTHFITWNITTVRIQFTKAYHILQIQWIQGVSCEYFTGSALKQIHYREKNAKTNDNFCRKANYRRICVQINKLIVQLFSLVS